MRLPEPEQLAFAATVAEVLAKHDPLAQLRRGPGDRVVDPDLWSALTGAGLLEPAEAGDILTTCLVAEELGRRAAPVPYLSAILGAALTTHDAAVAHVVEVTRGAAAAHDVAVAHGAALAPDAGLAPSGPGSPGGISITTIGLLAADGSFADSAAAGGLVFEGGLVSGTLEFVPDADCADSVVASGGGSLLIVKMSDGMVQRRVTLDSTQPLAAVVFDRAPATVLADGPTDLGRVRDLALAVHCASLVGSMRWLLDTTVEYAGQRVQFGQPIASRQAVKHACANLVMLVESSRALVLELADLLERGEDTALAAAGTKAWVSDAADTTAATALQLHGGIGFTWEHDLHHYFKRCTMGSTLFGTAAHHRGRVARMLSSPSPKGSANTPLT